MNYNRPTIREELKLKIIFFHICFKMSVLIFKKKVCDAGAIRNKLVCLQACIKCVNYSRRFIFLTHNSHENLVEKLSKVNNFLYKVCNF